MAQYTKLLGSEIEEIARQYKLKITDYEPIEQGLGNSNYLIKTIQGKFVLTVFEIEAERVTHMIKVLKLLEKYGFPAPRLQTSVKGEAQTKYQGKLVLVKHYITGHVEKNLDAGKLSQVGAALARLHEIPAPDYLPDKHSYVTKTYPEVMEQDIDLEYKNWIGHRYNHHMKNIPIKLPVGLIHGDLFFDNVLFEDEEFKAILDFEDVCRCHKVFDLGMAVVGTCTEGTKTDLNKVRSLVKGYQEVRLLEQKEKDSLQIFIECASILTSAWRFWKYNLDEPDIEKSDKYLQMVKIAKEVSIIPKMIFMNTVFLNTKNGHNRTLSLHTKKAAVEEPN